ncbi:MAG TPA: hypothetical protein VH333_04015 [Pseudonocardiaceae bacterium]|jgi:hypothetical protein|nr:hypothetical protein [Pseudonocardiaceae bacterium]
MDVLVPDWSEWTALKVCEVRPSLVSSARVGGATSLMRGAAFGAPLTAIHVLGPIAPPAEDEDEPEPANVD